MNMLTRMSDAIRRARTYEGLGEIKELEPLDTLTSVLRSRGYTYADQAELARRADTDMTLPEWDELMAVLDSTASDRDFLLHQERQRAARSWS